MVNMGAWLDRKYANLEQATQAQLIDANARAKLLGAQAEAVPTETAGRYQAELGQAAAGFGAGAQSQALATAEPSLAASEVGLRGRQGELLGEQAGDIRFGQQPLPAATQQRVNQRLDVTSGMPNFNLSSGFIQAPVPMAPSIQEAAPTAPAATAGTSAPSGGGVSVFSSPAEISAYKKQQGFSKGTEKVPGKGDGKTDSVAAKLAPGEAVLNKAAAEHLGRHTIALLNALGEQKMGMDDSQTGPMATDQGATQGYAKGTAKVPAKKAPAAAPAGGKGGKGKGPAAPAVSPKLLAALMQMGGGPGAGGMPGPGAAPMPMPMPMSGGPAISGQP